MNTAGQMCLRINTSVRLFCLQKNTAVEGYVSMPFSSVSQWVERLHMYDLSNVGERVKELRKKKGKTQEQIAYALGMNLKTYQAIEGGRRVGRVDTVCMLAEYFDTTVDYLLGSDKEFERTIEINYRNLSDDMKLLAKKQIAALLKVMH